MNNLWHTAILIMVGSLIVIQILQHPATLGATARPTQPLALTTLRLQQRDYPTNQWINLPNNQTFAGNLVRFVADVNQLSTQPITAVLSLSDSRTNQPITSCPATTIAPGSTQPVELHCDWDTHGWAWNRSSTPPQLQSDIPIRVTLRTTGVADQSTEVLVKILPSPVFLIHDTNATLTAMNPLIDRFNQTSNNWVVRAVPQIRSGISWFTTRPSNTLTENSSILHHYIEQERAALDAWHVDIVAHGYGGIIARHYITTLMPTEPQPNRPVVNHLVLLGTPNLGTACAREQLLLDMVSRGQFHETLYDQTPEVMAYWNQLLPSSRGVSLSGVIGVGREPSCTATRANAPLAQGDGWVSAQSAQALIHPSHVISTTAEHLTLTALDQNSFEQGILNRLSANHSEPPAVSASMSQSQAVNDLQYTTVLTRSIDGEQHVSIPFLVPETQSLQIQTQILGTVITELINPTGTTVITRGIDAEWRNVVRITDPTPGQWVLRIQNRSGQPAHIRLIASIIGSNLTLQPQISIMDGQLRLRGCVFYQGNAISGAALSARINNQLITLYDDGSHGDQQANDGCYHNREALPATGRVAVVFQANTIHGEALQIVVLPPSNHHRYLPVLQR